MSEFDIDLLNTQMAPDMPFFIRTECNVSQGIYAYFQ